MSLECQRTQSIAMRCSRCNRLHGNRVLSIAIDRNALQSIAMQGGVQRGGGDRRRPGGEGGEEAGGRGEEEREGGAAEGEGAGGRRYLMAAGEI